MSEDEETGHSSEESLTPEEEMVNVIRVAYRARKRYIKVADFPASVTHEMIYAVTDVLNAVGYRIDYDSDEHNTLTGFRFTHEW